LQTMLDLCLLSEIGIGAAALGSHCRHCQTSVEKLHPSTRLLWQATSQQPATFRRSGWLPRIRARQMRRHPRAFSPVRWSLHATPGEHWNGWRRGSVAALAGRVPPKTPRGAPGRACSRRCLAPPQVAVGPLAPRVQAAQDRPACPLPTPRCLPSALRARPGTGHGAGRASACAGALRACSPPAGAAPGFRAWRWEHLASSASSHRALLELVATP